MKLLLSIVLLLPILGLTACTDKPDDVVVVATPISWQEYKFCADEITIALTNAQWSQKNIDAEVEVKCNPPTTTAPKVTQGTGVL